MKAQTSRIIAIGLIVATALMIVSLACMRILRQRVPHIDVDRSLYPIVGVDLSAHNGMPDFDSLKAAGIDFAYLKASEGEGFRDPAFVRNYAAARRTGIAVGAYHFFRFDCDGRRQAVNALRATEGCNLDLPIAIDVEESGNPSHYSTELVISRLEAMVAHLQGAGRRVIVYSNKNGHGRFLRGQFDNVTTGDPELWICSFTNPPLPGRQWLFWQHSHCSRVPGVKGDVDINTFNGSREQWEAWLEEGQARRKAHAQ